MQVLYPNILHMAESWATLEMSVEVSLQFFLVDLTRLLGNLT